jgi:hypothetical protein
MEERLIETIEKEGLPTVYFFDASKKLAGDRWQVTLIVRMKVQVDEPLAASSDPIDVVRRRLGDTVTFEHKSSRTFIADNEKDDLLSQLCDQFKETGLSYLYHDDFRKNLIAKRYRDLLTKDYLNKNG